MVELQAQRDGLSIHLVHGPSGATLETVPPRDNGGTGERFSPTDLLAASLGACALTTLALVGAREGLHLGPARARIEKHMSGPPRRVSRLVVALELSAATPVEQRPRLEAIARTCPVALSLSSDTALEFHLSWTLEG